MNVFQSLGRTGTHQSGFGFQFGQSRSNGNAPRRMSANARSPSRRKAIASSALWRPLSTAQASSSSSFQCPAERSGVSTMSRRLSRESNPIGVRRHEIDVPLAKLVVGFAPVEPHRVRVPRAIEHERLVFDPRAQGVSAVRLQHHSAAWPSTENSRSSHRRPPRRDKQRDEVGIIDRTTSSERSVLIAGCEPLSGSGTSERLRGCATRQRRDDLDGVAGPHKSGADNCLQIFDEADQLIAGQVIRFLPLVKSRNRSATPRAASKSGGLWPASL